MIEVPAALLAGLGLFVFGVRQIQAGLQQLAGRGLRRLLLRATTSTWRAALTGIGLGFVTQNTNAATYIAISLTAAGLLPFSAALGVVAWATVGTSTLVFFASIRIELVVLYLVGITAFLAVSEHGTSSRYRAMIQSLFGIGMLFLGMQTVRGATGSFESMPVDGMVAGVGGHGAAVFAVGLVVAAVMQSSTTVAALGAALAATGAIPLEEQILLVYGACLGSAIGNLVHGWRLSGVGRRLLLFQGTGRAIGIAVLLALLGVEFAFGTPLSAELLGTVAPGLPALQTGIAFFLAQMAAALASTVLSRPIMRLVSRFAPLGRADAIAQPRFLYDHALDDPLTAVDLVEREQARLFDHLPAQLDMVRSDADPALDRIGRRRFDPNALEHGHATLARAIERFLIDLLARRHDGGSVDRIVALRSRNEIARAQIQTLGEFVRAAGRARDIPAVAPFAERLTEALHVLLATAGEAVGDRDPTTLALLEGIAGDRSEILEQARRALLLGNRDLSAEAQDDLFHLTSLFERSTWLIRRLIPLVRADEADPDGGPSAARRAGAHGPAGRWARGGA